MTVNPTVVLQVCLFYYCETKHSATTWMNSLLSPVPVVHLSPYLLIFLSFYSLYLSPYLSSVLPLPIFLFLSSLLSLPIFLSSAPSLHIFIILSLALSFYIFLSFALSLHTLFSSALLLHTLYSSALLLYIFLSFFCNLTSAVSVPIILSHFISFFCSLAALFLSITAHLSLFCSPMGGWKSTYLTSANIRTDICISR